MNKNLTLLLLSLLLCIFIPTSILACDKPYHLFHENGLYIVKVNLNIATIKPYVATKLETVYNIAKKTNASVAINTGFFDAKSKKTVSYIIENGEVLADPKLNTNLTSNTSIQPYLTQIFNRGELRLYNCNNKIQADITNHSEKYWDNCSLLSSTQAGPIILPEMDLEKEFFVIQKDGKVIRDGAGLTRKTDRSMVGIKGNNIYFIITDEKTKVTVFDLKDKIEKYHFDKAMGFDGGGSVSLYVKQHNKEFYQDREEKGASRRVKSALLVF